MQKEEKKERIPKRLVFFGFFMLFIFSALRTIFCPDTQKGAETARWV